MRYLRPQPQSFLLGQMLRGFFLQSAVHPPPCFLLGQMLRGFLLRSAVLPPPSFLLDQTERRGFSPRRLGWATPTWLRRSWLGLTL